MSCDKCGPNREKGYVFCPDCGSPLQEGCVYCAQYEREGYEFCGKCGRKLNPGPAAPADGTQSLKMAVLGLMPFVLILLGLEIVSMYAGAGSTFSWLEGQTKNILMLLPMLTTVGTLSGSALQAVWIVLMIVVTACLAVFIYQSKAMLKPRSDGDTSEAEKTPLYWMCLLFGAMVVINLIATVIGSVISGTPFGTPGWLEDMQKEDVLFSMTNAAVWEEIIARVLPIGIPFAILALCHGRKDFGRYLLGGFGMNRLAFVLLVLSSIVFGAAHLEGWGAVKFLPAAIGGFVLGYMFIRFGIHTSIIMHFMFDMSTTLMFYGNLGMMVMGGIILIVMISGIVCLIILMGKIRNCTDDIRSMQVTGFEKK